MAHWRLTPKQVSKLSEDDIETMILSYRMYEKRNLESLSDVIGTLTGTSWSIEQFQEDSENAEEDTGFTWKKRPERRRISLPLTVVVGGNKVLEHVKSAALKMQEKHDNAIISLPKRKGFLKDAKVIDLGRASKETFLRMARHVVNVSDNKV